MVQHHYSDSIEDEVRRQRDEAWNVYAAAGDFETALSQLSDTLKQTAGTEMHEDIWYELMAGHNFVAGRVHLAKELSTPGHTFTFESQSHFQRAADQFEEARRLRDGGQPSQVELHMLPHHLTAESFQSRGRVPKSLRRMARLAVWSARSESPRVFAPETINHDLDRKGRVVERGKRLAYAGLTGFVLGLNRLGRREGAERIARRYVLPGKHSAKRMSA